MAVRVGSARHDENGKITGGKAGDQTGDEVCRQNWYKHSKGWVCIRAKSADMREKIAKCMEYACDNNNIGYDQSQNTTLREVSKKYGYDCSKVTEKCETDCAKLVQVCIRYADFPACPSFYTGSEVEVLKGTGKFDILTADKYTTSSKYLMRGDILVTKVKGHTVVVLDNGSGVKTGGTTATPTTDKTSTNTTKTSENTQTATTKATLKRGSKGDDVKEMQKALRAIGFVNITGEEMKADGSFGTITQKTVTAFQVLTSIPADGICGPVTWAMIDSLSGKPEVKAKAVTDIYYRRGPAAGYQALGVIKEGATITYTVPLNDWLYIPAKKGWSKALYFELI